MDKQDITIKSIINILNIPQEYKRELEESYNEVIISIILEKSSLEKGELEEILNKKEDLLSRIKEKNPIFLEDKTLISSMEKVNESFIELLLSLANEEQKEKIIESVRNIIDNKTSLKSI